MDEDNRGRYYGWKFVSQAAVTWGFRLLMFVGAPSSSSPSHNNEESKSLRWVNNPCKILWFFLPIPQHRTMGIRKKIWGVQIFQDRKHEYPAGYRRPKEKECRHRKAVEKPKEAGLMHKEVEPLDVKMDRNLVLGLQMYSPCVGWKLHSIIITPQYSYKKS